MPAFWSAVRRRIDTPTLVLWSARDTALREVLIRNMAEVAPNSEVVVFPDTSHWIQMDAPDRVNEQLERFLKLPLPAPTAGAAAPPPSGARPVPDADADK